MKKQQKLKEDRRVKKVEYLEEEIPQKDDDGVDISIKKSIPDSLGETLTIKINALS